MTPSPIASQVCEPTPHYRDEGSEGIQRSVMSNTLLAALGRLVAGDRRRCSLPPVNAVESVPRLRHGDRAS